MVGVVFSNAARNLIFLFDILYSSASYCKSSDMNAALNSAGVIDYFHSLNLMMFWIYIYKLVPTWDYWII